MEQTGYCQFVIENKREEFSRTEGEKLKGKQMYAVQTHHTQHTHIYMQHIQGGSLMFCVEGLTCSCVQAFLSSRIYQTGSCDKVTFLG